MNKVVVDLKEREERKERKERTRRTIPATRSE